MEKQRSSGILMHISSLPGEYGIGDFGKEAYHFIDFLEKSKQNNWQILPIGITGYGNSPYQCFSAFAGNPYFIDLNEFIEKEYLTLNEIQNVKLERNPCKVDYGLLYKNKMKLLKIAYKRSKKYIKEELQNFYRKNIDWLREFALFMAIKEYQGNKSWLLWDRNYRQINSKEVLDFEKKQEDLIFFWIFTQYFFIQQWNRLKSYANKKGIHIIGDLPIYVSEDSSDVWANPWLFNLDNNLIPITISGCPPDTFSKEGQLWGNPIYNWDNMEKNEYNWWIKRFEHSFRLFDTLRIDHFRGFESYWEVPYGAKNAIYGQWKKGPGIHLFEKVKQKLGNLNIIAEDLGFLTEDVKKLLRESHFPGMKVLQFAFDSREESDYLPHNYDKDCVVYTGTHDNSTTIGWFFSAPKKDVEYATQYLKLDFKEGVNWGFIRGAWSSTAYLAITTMQDILGLDDRARMNIPATIGENWSWRMTRKDFTEDIVEKLSDITRIYGR
ncbi:4-alpha-glucanotransferase [Garciella nitratireducens]|uniref:4-alpha-glucanotransferase n=1 Tax=Garciella nitratireducens DSM 15102 TaxID=1121911 RepID=A0A1T4K8R0_9FIRM|nr:4-alpha-glucanotransferase [Garciella nitratireducens]SJZ38791.1 4-alpha-glucanotransferase [Garciella nitratireducens DSM 15102]